MNVLGIWVIGSRQVVWLENGYVGQWGIGLVYQLLVILFGLGVVILVCVRWNWVCSCLLIIVVISVFMKNIIVVQQIYISEIISVFIELQVLLGVIVVMYRLMVQWFSVNSVEVIVLLMKVWCYVMWWFGRQWQRKVKFIVYRVRLVRQFMVGSIEGNCVKVICSMVVVVIDRISRKFRVSIMLNENICLCSYVMMLFRCLLLVLKIRLRVFCSCVNMVVVLMNNSSVFYMLVSELILGWLLVFLSMVLVMVVVLLLVMLWICVISVCWVGGYSEVVSYSSRISSGVIDSSVQKDNEVVWVSMFILIKCLFMVIGKLCLSWFIYLCRWWGMWEGLCVGLGVGEGGSEDMLGFLVVLV